MLAEKLGPGISEIGVRLIGKILELTAFQLGITPFGSQSQNETSRILPLMKLK